MKAICPIPPTHPIIVPFILRLKEPFLIKTSRQIDVTQTEFYSFHKVYGLLILTFDVGFFYCTYIFKLYFIGAIIYLFHIRQRPFANYYRMIKLLFFIPTSLYVRSTPSKLLCIFIAFLHVLIF